MLKKTKGIVLSYLKYKESSIICKVFTRELGLRTYLVNGVRSQKSRGKTALYQPLTLLDLVVYEREGGNIQRVSEAKLEHAFVRLPFDFYRSGVAMFMAEILGKVIFENYHNEGLFDFVEGKVLDLDAEQVILGNFPLQFLIQLSGFLGFEPSDAREFYEELAVDKASPTFKERVSALETLLGERVFSKPSRAVSQELMDDWLKFYAMHMETFKEVKSLEVLRSLMDQKR
ncbi:DNA repair protein RecO [Pleomorphovibrio marinus]|uniref:DNA repair protein RecO n=1 Tax=Pleomorphovibrio marinus TaxID=2164132 RepID=UPI000E0A00B6|nr:DNA repair protein RecO [Pleomorphovibrio marinus]